MGKLLQFPSPKYSDIRCHWCGILDGPNVRLSSVTQVYSDGKREDHLMCDDCFKNAVEGVPLRRIE